MNIKTAGSFLVLGACISAVAAQTGCTYTEYTDGTDFYGNDLNGPNGTKGSSQGQCTSDCEANPSCYAIVLKTDGTCWLKGAGFDGNVLDIAGTTYAADLSCLRGDSPGTDSTPPVGSGMMSPPMDGMMTPPGSVKTMPPMDGMMMPPGSDMAMPPMDGMMLPPGSDTTMPPMDGMMMPPGSDTTMPPMDGIMTPPGSDMAMPPMDGMMMPPGSDLTMPPMDGLMTPPGSDMTMPPMDGMMTPPGSDSTMPPMDGMLMPPGSDMAMPPMDGMMTPPGSGVTMPPMDGMMMPPGSDSTMPPMDGMMMPPGMTMTPTPPISMEGLPPGAMPGTFELNSDGQTVMVHTTAAVGNSGRYVTTMIEYAVADYDADVANDVNFTPTVSAFYTGAEGHVGPTNSTETVAVPELSAGPPFSIRTTTTVTDQVDPVISTIVMGDNGVPKSVYYEVGTATPFPPPNSPPLATPPPTSGLLAPPPGATAREAGSGEQGTAVFGVAVVVAALSAILL